MFKGLRASHSMLIQLSNAGPLCIYGRKFGSYIVQEILTKSTWIQMIRKIIPSERTLEVANNLRQHVELLLMVYSALPATSPE